MRKLLLSATILMSLSGQVLASDQAQVTVSTENFTTIANTVNGYLGAAPVDTTTFEGGSVVNITPVLEQVKKTLTGLQVTDEDQQKYIKEQPAYISSDDYTALSKSISSMLTSATSAGGPVKLAAVSQAIDTTLSIAQMKAQVTPSSYAAAVSAETTAMRAYLKAMRQSGQGFNLSRKAFLAWAKAHGYKIPSLTYLTKMDLDKKFVVSTAPTSSATAQTMAGSGNTASTGTMASTGSGTMTGTGSTASTGTGTSGTTSGTATTGTVSSGTVASTGMNGSGSTVVAPTTNLTTTPTTTTTPPAGVSTAGAVTGTTESTAAATAAMQNVLANPSSTYTGPSAGGTSTGSAMTGLTGSSATLPMTDSLSSATGTSTTPVSTINPTSLGTTIGTAVGSQVSGALSAAASGMQ